MRKEMMALIGDIADQRMTLRAPVTALTISEQQELRLQQLEDETVVLKWSLYTVAFILFLALLGGRNR